MSDDKTEGKSYEVGHDLVLGDKREVNHFHGPVAVAVAVADPVLADAAKQGVDLRQYLVDLLEEVSTIKIPGIRSREASREPIEELYTPLKSRDPRAFEGRSLVMGAGVEAEMRAAAEIEKKEKDGRVELSELLPVYRLLLLEGQPGSGKTTFSDLVACMLARDLVDPRAADQRPWRSEFLGLPADKEAPIPALLRVRELAEALVADEGKPAVERRPNNYGWILQLLACRTRPAATKGDRGHDQRCQQWADWLAAEEGERALLILDGLDETANCDVHRRVVKIIRSACRQWPQCRIVVTSRPFGAHALSGPPHDSFRFFRAVIDDFGPEEIERFVGKWSRALFSKAPGRSAQNTHSLIQAIGGRDDLRKLARNPVMLTCLCVIHYNEGGQLPHGRARVYAAIVDWLINSRKDQRRAKGYGDGLVELALSDLAVAMMKGNARHPGKMTAIDFGDAARAIEQRIQRYFPADRFPEEPQRIAERFLRDECELSSAIERVGGNKLKFWHLTLQEYLVALAIARRSDWSREIDEHLDDPQWHEVMALVSGCVFETNGADRVDELVERLLGRKDGKSQGLLAATKRLIYLDRVLEPMQAYGYQIHPELELRCKQVAHEVMTIFTVEGAAQVEVGLRVAAAEVIGRWGDCRFDEGVDNFIDLPGLGIALGRYPVTVLEYSRFVEAGGYDERSFWGGVGWAWRRQMKWGQPWGWQDQQQHATRPVVGVSWHEARAYCRWMSGRLGKRVRLPKEEEWERAATREGQEYPWGAVGDEQIIEERLANYGKNMGSATPVGVYPEGAGPLGHLDLAGNVWEWCEDAPEQEWRWLKGGSWWNECGALAAAYRFRYWLDDFFVDFGFRVVVAREPVDL